MFYNRFFDEEGLDLNEVENRLETYDSGSVSLADFRQTSDTLVLHPDDRSTDFLSAIYDGKGWDVINDSFVGSGAVAGLIEKHDRIICLGHGSPTGLFGGHGFLIHDGLVPLLREKEMVSIWCHADQFMNTHGLKGFYSGMFISEVGEAWMCGIEDTTDEAVSISNNLFASVLGRHIDSENILEKVKGEYVGAGDPVRTFNNKRLYSR